MRDITWNWNAIAAGAAVLQALAAVVILVVTWRYVVLTRDLVSLGKEPQLDCYLVVGAIGEEKIVLHNDGVEAITDVTVNYSAVTFLGPPKNVRLGGALGFGGSLPGYPNTKDAWHVARLDPKETQERPLREVAVNGFRGFDLYKHAREIGSLPGVSPTDPEQFINAVVLRVAYKREVDGKRFTLSPWFLVHELTGGELMALDESAAPWFYPELASQFGKSGK